MISYFFWFYDFMIFFLILWFYVFFLIFTILWFFLYFCIFFFYWISIFFYIMEVRLSWIIMTLTGEEMLFPDWIVHHSSLVDVYCDCRLLEQMTTIIGTEHLVRSIILEAIHSIFIFWNYNFPILHQILSGHL